MPRIHCELDLESGTERALPAGAARHVQVLRLQPGDALTLFDGRGGEHAAEVLRMGRASVEVRIGPRDPVEREAPVAIHLLVGLMANERMDWLVEKATELGVASLSPITTSRSVLRLSGDRAHKRVAHWQAIAIAACEQCGRNRIPRIHPVRSLHEALSVAGPGARWVLSLAADARPWPPSDHGADAANAHHLLSGPEGGLTPEEEAAARAGGFTPTSLGPRVLRAETAPLAALVALTLGGQGLSPPRQSEAGTV